MKINIYYGDDMISERMNSGKKKQSQWEGKRNLEREAQRGPEEVSSEQRPG